MARFLPDGRAHAPFFIYMKLHTQLSDTKLLDEFGVSDFQQIDEPPHNRPYLTFGTCGDWTVIADDWYYSLWHLETTRPTIERLAKYADIYACSCGDIDHSFDFYYYLSGKLVRKYVVVDPEINNPTIQEDFGQPLAGEKAAFKKADEMDRVLSIADSLGIPRLKPSDNIRIYSHSSSWAVDFRATSR